jgi:glyoxylase-like metal-dependent hydrolase (beta-lactamase superfamily II)
VGRSRSNASTRDRHALWQTPDVATTAPVRFDAAPGIVGIDTHTAHQRQFNSVYLFHAAQPTLVEAASAADAGVLDAALDDLGLGPEDLAHVVVTHVHLDHAGGAAGLLERYPRATVWVHERGAPHLVDPDRLVASTARTYGEARMLDLYGRTEGVDPGRVRSVGDGDRIDLGDRSLLVVATPGHASHHVSLQDSATGVVCSGEAIGSHLPWVDVYRPALPAPEVDVEQALASIERIRALRPSAILTSHFGVVPDADEGCARAAARVRAWSDAVREALERDRDAPDAEIDAMLRAQAAEEYLADSGEPIDMPRYNAIGSIEMNARGLARYWRKRWEREADGVS